MTMLSPHFSLAEMTRSNTAVQRNLDNSAPPSAQVALKLLCTKVLEPLREHYGVPVLVSSGYRAPAVNRAAGGAASSQHCRGEAADFTVAGQSNLAVCRWMEKNLSYDQLIYEFGEWGWIHVSYSARQMRNQELRAVKRFGRTVYLPGLPS
tara:strand:- start:1329 stop:1781 length:453 start_codon:yes stop_codon:yes gene_type:complete